MQEFFDVAKKWARTFKAVHCNALSIRNGNEWWLRYATVFFRTEIPPTYMPLNLETKNVRAIRLMWELEEEESARLIEQLCESPNKINIREFDLALWPGFSLNDQRWTANFKGKQHLVQNPSLPGPLRLPTLIVHGPVVPSPKIEILDLELAHYPQPYDNLAELVGDLHLPIKPPPPLERPRIDWVIFPPIKYSDDKLQAGKLRFKLKTHSSIASSQLRLGAKIFTGLTDPIQRVALDANTIVWKKEKNENVGEFLADVPEAKVVEVLASSNGELAARWWVRDLDTSLNDRLALHKAAFGDYNFADDFFENKNEFESKIALTLNLLGLNCVHYGEISKLQDMCDILAVSDKRHVFVIECTTGRLDHKGKLLKLRDRCSAIKERLTQLPLPPTAIAPVIFTSLPREETTSDWPAAAAFGIAVIGKSEIENMLTRLSVPPSADEIFSSVVGLIPTTKLENEAEEKS